MGSSISDKTLEQLFPNTLTNTSCVYVDKDSEVWIATEMCSQYIESNVDSILITENGNPIAIVGGYDLLDNIRKNPTRDFQYDKKIEQIMFTGIPQINKDTKLQELIEKWKGSRRAFAVIPNESGKHSPISARKMLEVGARCETDYSISSIPKKRIVTFSEDDTLGKVVELMFENNTRKLLLENSNRFISDRIVLGHISNVLKFQKDIDNFLEIPVRDLHLDKIHEIKDDLKFNHLCSKMDKMDHPFVIYKDNPISPWDICLTMIADDFTANIGEEYHTVKSCPHCGKEIR